MQEAEQVLERKIENQNHARVKLINNLGEEHIIRTEGRHDPCICPRIVPVVEAMACLVLEDQYKRQAAMLG